MDHLVSGCKQTVHIFNMAGYKVIHIEANNIGQIYRTGILS